MLNGILLATLALGTVLMVLWLDRSRNRRPDDPKLDEWLSFLVKGESVEPEKRPRTARASLPRDAYETIKKFTNPKLQAEFEEKALALENEIAARAIQVEKVERRIASGKPLSNYDLAILRREGLLGETKRDTKDVPENSSEPV